MIVHLAGSIRDLKTDPEYLRRIIDIVHDQGGTIAYNWLEPAIIRKKENLQVGDWKPYVDANLEAIKRADLLIVEASHYTFSKGFQVGAALEYKKPTLLISRESLNDRLASGIVDPLLKHKTYSTQSELEKVVRIFIEQNTVHTKDLRFNMLLTRSIFKFLDDTSQSTGKSRSEIVRELIKRKMAGK